jgi:phage anti-repressor protein
MPWHQYFTDKVTQWFWHAVPRKPDYQDGFPEILPKDGFMQNIHYYQVQRIPGSEENVGVLRGELKKLND